MSRGSWRPAYVGLGSNLAGPRQQVERAFEALAGIPDTLLVARSGLWSTAPLGPQDQPRFVNAAAGLLTRLGPRELLAELKSAERRMGRQQPVVRWGPRIIDLDLLVYGDERIEEAGLTLPHPGLPERNFVLYPLSEFAAELWVPGLDRVGRLRGRVSAEGIEPLAAGKAGDD
ncbi:MAG TPA: 2-amino-4-hydroxy-6-hydroxymethyldihydropteridine diphosphokinase [Steroidobacteraceae bacterium]|nr:2-amino-4-hydroxy-6-hydroxymethyldihydropteridine diphosphokinase [Steroidobacteraceae bacterium]